MEENKWLRNKYLFFILSHLAVAIVVYIVTTQFFWKQGDDISPSSTNTKNLEFSSHVTLSPPLSHGSRTHEHVVSDNWTADLSPATIKGVNEFVGFDKHEVEQEQLPDGGYQLRLNKKYRHVVVLRKNSEGVLEKHEVGPNGIR